MVFATVFPEKREEEDIDKENAETAEGKKVIRKILLIQH